MIRCISDILDVVSIDTSISEILEPGDNKQASPNDGEDAPSTDCDEEDFTNVCKPDLQDVILLGESSSDSRKQEPVQQDTPEKTEEVEGARQEEDGDWECINPKEPNTSEALEDKDWECVWGYNETMTDNSRKEDPHRIQDKMYKVKDYAELSDLQHSNSLEAGEISSQKEDDDSASIQSPLRSNADAEVLRDEKDESAENESPSSSVSMAENDFGGLAPWETIECAVRWACKDENARKGPEVFLVKWQQCYKAAVAMAEREGQGSLLCSLLVSLFEEHLERIKSRILRNEDGKLIARILYERDQLSAVLETVSDFLLYVDQLQATDLSGSQATTIFQLCNDFWCDLVPNTQVILSVVELIQQSRCGESVNEELIQGAISMIDDIGIYIARFEGSLLRSTSDHFRRTACEWVSSIVMAQSPTPEISQVLAEERCRACWLYPKSENCTLNEVVAEFRSAIEPMLTPIVTSLLDAKRYDDLAWVHNTFFDPPEVWIGIVNTFEEHIESASTSSEASGADTVELLIGLWDVYSCAVTLAFDGSAIFWRALCRATRSIADKRNMEADDWQRFARRALLRQPQCVSYFGETE